MIKTQTLIRSVSKKIKNLNKVNQKAVFDFKENYCNENDIIVEIITNKIFEFFKAPILDVGSGIGDISFKALKGKKVIMIDVNPRSSRDYPIRPEHTRKRSDLFSYRSIRKINTVLISHTLQFIDDDVKRLNTKLASLKPQFLIIIINANDDFMKNILNWCYQNCQKFNPEIKLDDFPLHFSLVKTEKFTAQISCPSFELLAEQISYLMLFDITELKNKLVEYLKSQLETPAFTINQNIEIYKRNEKRQFKSSNRIHQ